MSRTRRLVLHALLIEGIGTWDSTSSRRASGARSHGLLITAAIACFLVGVGFAVRLVAILRAASHRVGRCFDGRQRAARRTRDWRIVVPRGVGDHLSRCLRERVFVRLRQTRGAPVAAQHDVAGRAASRGRPSDDQNGATVLQRERCGAWVRPTSGMRRLERARAISVCTRPTPHYRRVADLPCASSPTKDAPGDQDGCKGARGEQEAAHRLCCGAGGGLDESRRHDSGIDGGNSEGSASGLRVR